jgi:hypothetical protein
MDVGLRCLLPLFLIPAVNALPYLFDLILIRYHPNPLPPAACPLCLYLLITRLLDRSIDPFTVPDSFLIFFCYPGVHKLQPQFVSISIRIFFITKFWLGF